MALTFLSCNLLLDFTALYTLLRKHLCELLRYKINLITKITALILALAQGLGIVLGLGGDYIVPIFGANLKWLTSVVVILVLMAGTCFTMWLGDKITEQGIGNGLSLIIFVGIIATAAQSIVNAIKNISNSLTYLWELVGFLALVLLIFFLIAFVDMAERRITVQYTKQVKGNKMYGGQSSYIPMKVNSSGVMPIIFASAIITFPSLILSLFGKDAASGGFAGFWFKYFGTNTVLYSILTALLILFFAYFYAQIQFNPHDVSLNIQQHGGFIPGIRPGKPTTEYLKKVSNRITLFGAIFLAFLSISSIVSSEGLINPITMIAINIKPAIAKRITETILFFNHSVSPGITSSLEATVTTL